VRVAPGDLVIGDADGVIVIPQAVETEALDLAFSKVRGENQTREELERGDKLADVFARHGIL
jgi:regulator of RNase E activity RraA